MKCNNPSIGKYVFLYDELVDAELRASLDQHLLECPQCMVEFRVYNKETSTWLSDDHPTDYELFEYGGKHPESVLSEDQIRRIRIHISVCDLCSELIEEREALGKLADDYTYENEVSMLHEWTQERKAAFVRELKQAFEEEFEKEKDKQRYAAQSKEETPASHKETIVLLLTLFSTAIFSQRSKRRSPTRRASSNFAEEGVTLIDETGSYKFSIYPKFKRLFIRIEDPQFFEKLAIPQSEVDHLAVRIPFISEKLNRFAGNEADLGKEEEILKEKKLSSLAELFKNIEKVELYLLETTVAE